ncbi:transcription-repair coupling factor [Ferroacidibacillus organovorans]|uniref:Transcription-repair-coupling factor n=1 Tax=Ferroacidibacillus organovorans TaxID=1765683 RepID=A0A1V4EVH1_9BACL|nr:transcription-repair coupling factor [Ferroacidibacillus organovorans]OPG16840.1 transcription-repair coupling factor [Ferroacidibacillus organovorans]
MRELVLHVASVPDVKSIHRALEKPGASVALSGIGGAARHLLYATVCKRGYPVVIAAHSMQAAEVIAGDLTEWLRDEEVCLFPEREISHSEMIAFSPELAALRMSTLARLSERATPVIVTTIRALSQRIFSPQHLQNAATKLVCGETHDPKDVMIHLIDMGYERVERVEARGQCSLRGGILDVYALYGQPVRVEWFDLEIDSIRFFDPETQRSLEKMNEVRLWPARELIATAQELHALADLVEACLHDQIQRVSSVETREHLREHLGRDLERMRSAVHFPGLLRYAGWLEQRDATLLDHVPQDAIILFDEPTRLRETMERIAREEAEWTAGALEHGEILPNLVEAIDPTRLFVTRPLQRHLYVSLLPRHMSGIALTESLTVSTRVMQQFHGQLPLLKSEIARMMKANEKVVLLASDRERSERLLRVLEDFSISATIVEAFDPALEKPMILIGALSAGFEWSGVHLAVISENEVFATKKRARRVRSDASEAAKIKSYQDLQVGDYVVHATHGIAKYLGIETLVIEGNHRDYLNLRYAGNDKLYVPVEQINLVQKYLGNEEKEPRVHHLGGTDFARAKSKVRKSVQDIAEQLIKLYAQREATPGYSFREDTDWQRDFETMFPYEETPDQLRAIRDIKSDMERARPMDRLLCGDVGYGKTEVAIRAASKAVFDSKQVAVLVPTTILAQQHYETFRERFSGYPVTVEVLSRFRSKTETTRVMQGLKTGAVDIVIGTHRLLQKQIAFKDLGLLIVDEEQRFGVTHKERLKQLRANVDCLTLTATPIPRTLHLSMVGLRDLSVIETPPENRFPVQTYVVEYSDALLRESIEREISRGGQVYVLYNQVKGIDSIAERVARLVPDARVTVGHGQMAEDELERVMLDFLQGDTDVLVSTTIIETGLDIPNVNTLIVFHADRMGLSQLYQLRGRVGRSNRIAYAYFTYQQDKVLTEVAEKRLQAIKEFTELGSGFKIAMRDLSIRGAGNILGAEQHGFISAVGFDMYTEMLAEAVRELRGDSVQEKPEPTVEISMDAYLPDDYVTDPMQKIEMYKKIVAAIRRQDVDDLYEELEDRFGNLPDPVHQLVMIARIRAFAHEHDLASIVKQGHDMHITFRSERTEKMSGARLFELTQLYPRRMRLKSTGDVYTLILEGRGLKDDMILDMTIRVLSQLDKVYENKEELPHAKQNTLS